jgi:uncharacterized membrane protein
MRAQLEYLRYKLDSSFWFLPSLMILGAIALSFAMVALDRALIDASIDVSDWLYSATPDGARQLLTTIASSIITVTSLVFSMTLVALTLASQQLGPRLLENFMRYRTNQLVLGFFVATFVYSLLVLRTISDIDEAHFVPSCAIVAAIGMSIVSFAILIFFIHHVAQSIQADSVVANVAGNLDQLIERNLVARDDGPAAPKTDWPEDFENRCLAVCATQSGYVQTLDIAALKKLAAEQNAVFQLDYRPGHFVIAGRPVAYIYPESAGGGGLQKDVASQFVIGPKRTPAQDVEYEIRVLAEIAVRALSPGINDYYTATTCVDRLTAALVSILQYDFPPRDVCDDTGRVVLRSATLDFEGMLDTAFNDIRQSAAGNTAVTIRLLEALATLAGIEADDAQRRAIGKHIAKLERSVGEFIADPSDKADAEMRLKEAHDALTRHS